MVEEVNNIVFNLLISGRDVFLPTVGSLFTRYAGAQLLTYRRLGRGVREVVYSTQERGFSLVDAIAGAAGCDRHEAEGIYDRWLAHTLTGQVLTIKGVGVVRQRRFIPDGALDVVLNPLGRAPLVLRGGGRVVRRVAFAAAAALLLAAAGYGYVALLETGPSSGRRTQHGEVVAVLPVADGPAANAAGGVADANAAAECTDGSGLAAEQTDGLLSVRTEQQPAVCEEDAKAALRLADTLTDKDIAASVSPDAARERLEVTEPSDRTATGTDSAGRTEVAQVPAQMESGQTYLVLGVYSTVENARRAAQQTATKHPDVVPHIYRFGEKFMVSIGAYASREEAKEVIRAYGTRFRGLWPYSKK